MAKYLNQIRLLNKNNLALLIFFSPVAFSTVATLFPWAFEVPNIGFRNSFLLFIIWALLTVSYSLARAKIFKVRLESFSRLELFISLSLTFTVFILFFLIAPIRFSHYFNLFLPEHTLEILPINKQNDSVELIAFNAEWGGLPSGKIDLPYRWQGKPGPSAILTLKPETSEHKILISWDGKEQIVDLSIDSKKSWLNIRQNFEVPNYHSYVYIIFFIMTLCISFFTFSLLVLWTTKNNLLRLTIPMLFVWTIYLLTFWPGLSSYDTMQQWGEAQTGVFTDAHPALHTMFISLISKVFPTPAAIAIIQILALALVTAWGLVYLQKRGVPSWATWSLTFGFALFPVNSLLVITVWKDIFYGCAILAFFIQFLKITLSNGNWLDNKKNLVGIIIVGVAASFLRHNGFPVIISSLAILFLPFQKKWKSILLLLIVISGIFLFIRGPFYDLMKVKKYPGMINILLLEHIGAHIKAATPIDPNDLTYLNQLISIDKWPYNCANSTIRNMDGPIPFDYFTVNDPRPLQIAIKLFLKNPIIDVRHTLCAGGLFWMLDPGYSIYTLPMTRRGQYGSPNDYGITSHPLLPGFLNIIPVPLSDSPLIWKPAFYLYLFLFCLSILIFRSKSIKIMLISTPIIIQTLVMILVNYANDFRYIFSTELCAILMVGVILLPKNELQKTDPNHKNEHVERI